MQAICSFDSDKLAHVVVSTDPLNHWDANDINGVWEEPSHVDQIEAAMAKADSFMFNGEYQTRAALQLVLLQGVGRATMCGFNGPPRPDRSHLLAMSVASLETISWLGGVDQLTLWQFAQASSKIRDQSRILAFDTLDEFACYRSHKCSYYMSDDLRPNLISITPGYALELRCEVQNRCDIHSVRAPHDERMQEVGAWYSDRNVPIYCRMPGTDAPLSLLVEGLPVAIWVQTPLEVPDLRYREPYLYLADMLAYWIWRMSPGLSPILEHAIHKADYLLIQLDLIPDEQWFDVSGNGSPNDTVLCEPIDSQSLRLTLGSGAAGRLATADNSGERDVMREVLRGLREWGILAGLSNLNLSDAEIDKLIDDHIPLGQQKKLLMLSTGRHPELDDRQLDYYRPIQDFDGQEILEDIGEYLTRERGHIGEIPSSQRVTVLNDIVGYLFRRLRQMIGELSPEKLLERLVGLHERLVYEQESARLNTPTWIACFGSESAMVDRMRREIPQASSSAIACRFLIELVTALPLKGSIHLSLATYDRMLAIAGEIVGLGNASDAIHYEMDNRKVKVLASGRLGLGESEFEEAMGRYFEVHAVAEISRRQAEFESFWEPTGGKASGDLQPLLDAVDRAALAEFGHTLQELNEFIAQILHLGLAKGGALHVARIESFFTELEKELQWDRSKVRSAFDFFALRERPDFLRPPPGLEKSDVWPWRFNRALSYIRKPLVVRSAISGDEVIWGTRHLTMAIRYLNSICRGGRLKARSKEMRQAMGALHTWDGARFNDAVADLFETAGGFSVRRRVKKFNGKRIGRANWDIDVIFADPGRRELFPVETKDLVAGLTPSEMRNELDEFFGTKAGRSGHLQKFEERVEWIDQHRKDASPCPGR